MYPEKTLDTPQKGHGTLHCQSCKKLPGKSCLLSLWIWKVGEWSSMGRVNLSFSQQILCIEVGFMQGVWRESEDSAYCSALLQAATWWLMPLSTLPAQLSFMMLLISWKRSQSTRAQQTLNEHLLHFSCVLFFYFLRSCTKSNHNSFNSPSWRTARPL